MIFVQIPTRTSTVEGDSGGDPFDILWTITLSEAPTSDVVVKYRFLPGTADITSGFNVESDAYGSLERTVTFAAGETSKQVGLNIEAETNVEFDESVILEVFEASGSGAALTGGAPVLRQTSFIQDDDGTGQKRMLDVSSPIVTEGDAGTKNLVFNLVLSRDSNDPITVDYRTVDGSAKAGEDYVASQGSITFGSNQTERAISVSVLGDTDIEAAEFFSLDVDAPSDVIPSVSDGIGTILTDDPDGPSVSVAGTRTKEGNSGGDPHDILWTITLSEAPTSDVEVSYRILGGTADISSGFNVETDAYGTLESTITFAAGETSKQVGLNIEAETVAEFDETAIIEVFEASGSGAQLENNAPVLRATSFILDDDGTGNKLTLDVSSPEMIEGDNGTKNMVFVVSLSRPA